MDIMRDKNDTADWWQDLCGEVDRRTKRTLRSLGTETTFLPGSEIVKVGARADQFSLVLSGEVEIEVDGRVVSTLGAGEHFGEIAMLYAAPKGPVGAPVQIPRTATVRATALTQLRQFDRAQLVTLMDAAPVAAARITRRAIGRLAVLNQELVNS